MTSSKFKICIFGDSGVGKTTLINRYLTGVFEPDYNITIGVELYVKKLQIDGIDVTLQIWDFAGEKDYRFLFPSYVKDALGGIFMYDVTNYDSFKNLYEWLLILDEASIDYVDNMFLIMVGGKNDLEESRVILSEDAKKIADKFKFKDFIECSSRTGKNIEKVFEKIAELLVEKHT